MPPFPYSVILALLLFASSEVNASHHTSFIPNRMLQTVASQKSFSSELFASTSALVNDEIVSLRIDNEQHLFHESNAISRSMPVPHPEIWKRCFHLHNEKDKETARTSSSFWEKVAQSFTPKQTGSIIKHGVLKDVEIVFDDEPTIGARELLEKCGVLNQQYGDDNSILPETLMKEQETLSHLTNVLSYYQTILSTHSNGDKACRARIVCTSGSIGTKCPRWHADHVPVRLIMSLVGPGCEYIPFEMERCEIDGKTVQMVNRHALNNIEDDDTSMANELIVPSERVETCMKQCGRNVVTCANAGDVVLLMGRGWEDRDNSEVLAAVHRSPTLKDGEERILLTLDVADWDYSHQ